MNEQNPLVGGVNPQDRKAWEELLAQMRELEVLVEETAVPPHRLSDYWGLSADLIILTEDLPAWTREALSGTLTAGQIREKYLHARLTLQELQARAQELATADDDLLF